MGTIAQAAATPTCDGWCSDLQMGNLWAMGTLNLPLGQGPSGTNNGYTDVQSFVTVSQTGAGLGGIYIPTIGTPRMEMTIPLRLEIEDTDPVHDFTNGSPLLDVSFDTLSRFGTSNFSLPAYTAPLATVGRSVTYFIDQQLDVVTGTFPSYSLSKLKAPLGYDVNGNGALDNIYIDSLTLRGQARLTRQDPYTIDFRLETGTYTIHGGVMDAMVDPLFNITLAASSSVSAVPLPASFWLLATALLPLVRRRRV